MTPNILAAAIHVLPNATVSAFPDQFPTAPERDYDEQQLIARSRLALGQLLAQAARHRDLGAEELLALSPDQQRAMVEEELRLELPLSGIVEIAVEVFEGYVNPS